MAWLFVSPSTAPAHAPADPLTGQHLFAPADRLAVIDGDTLRVGDQVVRLEAIIAPARGSFCHIGASGVMVVAGRATATGEPDQAADCGAAAANALNALVRGAPVDCAIHGHDAAGRPVAACQSAGVPLSEALVRDGWARVQAGDPYADLRQAEAAARAAGRGLWRTSGAF